MPVSVDKAVTARLIVSNLKFEILVDPEKALQLRRGENVRIEDILAYPAIYKDTGSTELAAEKDLQKIFGTTDVFKVAEEIIKKGDIQLTTEQRRRMIEERKKQIAEIISKRGVNPQTNLPHPPQRIMNAMKEAKVNIDPFVDAELQVDEVLKKIRVLLPIKLGKTLFQIKIPPEYSGRVYSVLKKIGSVQKEKWLTDGSLQVEVEVLVGMQSELLQRLADLTRGKFESKILKKGEL